METALTPDIVFAIFFIIGCIIRTVLPYIKKKAENPELKFDPKFGWTMILAVIIGFIEMMGILAADPQLLTTLSIRAAIFFGFFNGLGMNEILNEIAHRG